MKIEYEGPTWNAARKDLKIVFEDAGILHNCELRYPGVCDNYHLTFAHSLRRNFIATKEQMIEVIRACQKCHAKLDAQEHDATYAEVRLVIDRRIIPVQSIYEKDHTDPRRLPHLSTVHKKKKTTTKRGNPNRARRKTIRYS